jgi:hypothetical protein
MGPLELANTSNWDEPWKFDLRQMAARFLCLNKGGQLSNARTEILPHQIFTAHTVVSNAKRRFMLADEVGLGKTVEAGMVWQALSQRGNAARTLVICPAGLTRQWQEEFQDKFQQMFEIFGRDFQAVNPRIWDLKATAIASLDRLKRKEHKRTLLENRKWDLIIFDEAQHLSARDYPKKTDKTQNYQLAEALRDYTDAMLLLTATPHAGDPNHGRFINLVKLLEANVDFTPLVDEGLFRQKDAIPYSKLILRTPKLKVTDAQGHAVFKGRRTIPLDFRMHADERAFYDAVEDYIRTGYNALENIEDPMHRRAIGFILTSFQKLSSAPNYGIGTKRWTWSESQRSPFSPRHLDSRRVPGAPDAGFASGVLTFPPPPTPRSIPLIAVQPPIPPIHCNSLYSLANFVLNSFMLSSPNPQISSSIRPTLAFSLVSFISSTSSASPAFFRPTLATVHISIIPWTLRFLCFHTLTHSFAPSKTLSPILSIASALFTQNTGRVYPRPP